MVLVVLSVSGFVGQAGSPAVHPVAGFSRVLIRGLTSGFVFSAGRPVRAMSRSNAKAQGHPSGRCRLRRTLVAIRAGACFCV